MGRGDDTSITLDDDDGHRLHATWSRSGRRLIVSVHEFEFSDAYQQVLLRPDQVDGLRKFLDFEASDKAPDAPERGAT